MVLIFFCATSKRMVFSTRYDESLGSRLVSSQMLSDSVINLRRRFSFWLIFSFNFFIRVELDKPFIIRGQKSTIIT